MKVRGQFAYATSSVVDWDPFHTATYQPGPTRIYQNPNSAPPNVDHPAPPPQLQAPPSRPHSIGELAERAEQALGEDPRPLKAWLRISENARRVAKIFQEKGDLESAFVEYAKADIALFEKIPAHPDYKVRLDTTKRHNLRLQGQEILDNLAKIKISIMTRYEQWYASEDNTPRHREEAERRQLEQDSILSRQREADLQMPLESLTRSRHDNPNKPPIQPVTTTSLSPQLSIPSLMTQHQISQGYHPSLGSMSHRQSHSTPGGSDLAVHNLKTISFPRDCMNSFTSIASINTARNRETCGLLLGKDEGGRYAVTTLLIPKQHAKSDICVIDEEELVMRFLEERPFITLGWIHTHPTQSCFMSSVDLHTHSRFQRMLPESISVVCAPNSTRNFGIFRLTDPPGLQTILQCTALAAFHPHSDRHIYTDADKGHVQITSSGPPLEIVDLREHAARGSMGFDALPSRRGAVALLSVYTLEAIRASLSRYHRSKAGHHRGGEEEEVAHVAGMAGGHDEPISEPETPKQRPAAPHPTDTSMQSEAAANPTPEVLEGFDMLRRPPESQLHGQQLDYLRILQDKFGTPRPDRGHSYSFIDDNSSRHEEDGDYRESFVDPDNESYNVRCSGKTVSKELPFSPSILSPASSQLTSRFN